MEAEDQKQLNLLHAKVIALMILVEDLYANMLADIENPAIVGEQIVAGLSVGERAASRTGDSATAMQITEAVTFLVDRAVSKAIILRQRRGSP